MWVLVNSFTGKCYLYKEGYVRTSSKIYQEYDPDLPGDEQIYMQLTNNAVQKNGEDYGKFEEGNIISLTTLFKYISNLPNSDGKSAATLYDKFKQTMIEYIRHSLRAVKSKL